MTAPNEQSPPTGPPPEPAWAPVPEPPAESRSEPDTTDEDRGRPVGHWVAGGGSGLGIVGTTLYETTGVVGLAAGAVVAAGGAVTYGVYRLRGGRSPLARAGRAGARRTSRLLSGGKGGPKLGKGPKLFSGKGAKLGGGKGPKLGKGGGPKLGGKSGKLLGGKAGKLGGGKAGRLLGGGRGSRLGGKLGTKGVLGRAGRAHSRLGSTGTGRSRGGLLGRGGKAGLGLGARGGKLLGGKSKAGFGRWGKSAGVGAGLLGSKFGRGASKLGRKAGAAALRTKAGQRAGKGFGAAKAAMTGKTGGSRWSRFKTASKAARSAMGSNKNPFARWAASVAAAMVALTAMGHGKWKARQAKQQAAKDASAGTPTPDAKKPRRCTWCGSGIDEDEVREVVLHGLPCTICPTCYKPHDPATYPWSDEQLFAHAGDLSKEVLDSFRKTGGPDQTAGPTPYTTRRRTMSAFPLLSSAAEMAAAAASYAPQDPFVIARELDQMPEVTDHVALSTRSYAQRIESGYPIDPVVSAKILELYAAQAQMRGLAEEIGPLFRKIHAEDLKREEAPRTNEHLWNV